MSDYGVNFNNGSTGGEYSHTLSQQELPSFNISGNTSTAGAHYHDSGWGESYGGRYGYYGNEKIKKAQKQTLTGITMLIEPLLKVLIHIQLTYHLIHKINHLKQ